MGSSIKSFYVCIIIIIIMTFLQYERSPIADAVEKGHRKIIETLIAAYPQSIRYRTKVCINNYAVPCTRSHSPFS